MVAQNLAGRTVDNSKHPSQARDAVVTAIRIRPVRIENGDIDIARGDMIARPANRPHTDHDIDAMLCWVDSTAALDTTRSYSLLHTTKTTRVSVKDLLYRIDVNSLHRDETATSLALNEIGRVRLRTQAPLLFDSYRRNRNTGAFILIDDATNHTVAGGMILAPAHNEPHVVWHGGAVTRDQRATRGLTVWFTGLSGSGKSSVAVSSNACWWHRGRPHTASTATTCGTGSTATSDSGRTTAPRTRGG